jgi:hypothetical protein
MGGKLMIAAQLSSVHSTDEELAPSRVAARVGAMAHEVPLDILAVGWTERPDLFRMLTAQGTRLSKEVFLWYPILSDYPGFDPSHLVVTRGAGRSTGWKGYEGTGIRESFKQSCPNNPQAAAATLGSLEKLLAEYEFDGVFVDKIRFPSMANGLQETFSCFCPFCREKAARRGLDLDEVKAALGGAETRAAGMGAGTAAADLPPGARWLEEFTAEQPVVRQFLRFRADSINEFLATTERRVRNMGRKVSLDVFSPLLAPLVGQDFPFMARHADWVKPMIYRFGNGPSSLRTEIPATIRELGGHLRRDERSAMSWACSRVEGLEGSTLGQIEHAAPLGLIQAESRAAVRLFAETPVYLGVESVSIPGGMQVSPAHVEEILDIGVRAGVGGFVLSWDLLHTPIENVMPLKSLR